VQAVSQADCMFPLVLKKQCHTVTALSMEVLTFVETETGIIGGIIGVDTGDSKSGLRLYLKAI
jgi:hypothetical protein